MNFGKENKPTLIIVDEVDGIAENDNSNSIKMILDYIKGKNKVQK